MRGNILDFGQNPSLLSLGMSGLVLLFEQERLQKIWVGKREKDYVE
jgi:hypothetical protein